MILTDVKPGESITLACSLCSGQFGMKVSQTTGVGPKTEYSQKKWERYWDFFNTHEKCEPKTPDMKIPGMTEARSKLIDQVYASNPGIKFADMKKLVLEIEELSLTTPA